MSFCAPNVFLPWDFILSSKFHGYSTSSRANVSNQWLSKLVFNNTLLVVFVFTFHCGHIQDGSYCLTNISCLFMYMFLYINLCWLILQKGYG